MISSRYQCLFCFNPSISMFYYINWWKGKARIPMIQDFFSLILQQILN